MEGQARPQGLKSRGAGYPVLMMTRLIMVGVLMVAVVPKVTSISQFGHALPGTAALIIRFRNRSGNGG